MSALAGFYGTGGPAHLNQMCAAMAHRGGEAVSQRLDRDHRFMMMQAGGQRPENSNASPITVFCDGFISNQAELIEALRQKGLKIDQELDQSFLLARAWESWGTDMLARLSGGFALAIYDSENNILFLARDRFGQKPLFYGCHDKGMVFASELQGLCQHPEIRADIDPTSIQKFFAYGFFPASRTPYKSIHKLLPGHFTKINVMSGEAPQSISFASFRTKPHSVPSGSMADHAENLISLLTDSAKRLQDSGTLQPNVLLSGGPYSSALLSCLPAPSKAWTMDFRDTPQKSGHAANIAEKFGAEHWHEICTLDRVRGLIPDLLKELGEPLGSGSVLSMHLLANACEASACFAGHGGRGLFGGYAPIPPVLGSIFYHAIPNFMYDHVIEFLRPKLKTPQTLEALRLPPEYWGPIWLGALDPAERSSFFTDPLAPEDLYSEALEFFAASGVNSVRDGISEYAMNFYLPGQVLACSDRVGVSAGLDISYPYLDTKLVEFLQNFSAAQRHRLFQAAFAEKLPRPILGYRSHRLMKLPHRWMQSFSQPQGPDIAGLEEPAFILRWREMKKSPRRDDRRLLWCWMALKMALK